MPIAHDGNFIKKQTRYVPLQKKLERMALRAFPTKFSRRLRFLIEDCLLVRRMGYETDDPRLILQSVTSLKMLCKLMYEAENERAKGKEATVINNDEIDEAILNADQQASIDQAIKKNQEAVENARRSTRADGLPVAKPGYTWKPSNNPDSQGILVPVRVDGGKTNGADRLHPEGERSPASFEIVAKPREGS